MTALLLVIGCASEDKGQSSHAKGGKQYGGVFKWNETGELRSIFPLNMTQSSAQRTVRPIYQGLTGFDPKDLSIQPSLAESWNMYENGRVFDFKIRKGVKFHDNACFPDGKGRELVPQDVVWCLNQICRQSSHNQMFWLFQDRVLGANTLYSTSTKDPNTTETVKGISLMPDGVIRIELTSPYPAFLSILAHHGCWIYPREFAEHYEDKVDVFAVGTGPFQLNTFKEGEVVLLDRNPDYWGQDEHGNTLPFLDVVKINFERKKEVEVEEFLNGNLSIIQEIPLSRKELLTSTESGNMDYVVQSTSSLTAQFYCFNMNNPPFDDVRVRRAIAMAIDKDHIADSILSGLAIASKHGLVPTFFKDYPKIEGVGFNPEAAQQLLAEAGYPNGEGFPVMVMQFSGSGFGYVDVVNAIQGMLKKHLNIRVPISTLPSDQYFDLVETGSAKFWREGWLADHPDPENFLALFYGKNAPQDSNERTYLNTTRFRDAEFDKLFVQAGREPDVESRMAMYAAADQRLMEMSPVIPIYFSRATRLVRTDIQGLYLNGMESIRLDQVWIDRTATIP